MTTFAPCPARLAAHRRRLLASPRSDQRLRTGRSALTLYRCLVAVVVAGLTGIAVSPRGAIAATYTWTGATNNTWSTAATNWSDGGTNIAWPSTGSDNDAVFGGAAATISISGGVSANDLAFTTTGYTITSGTLTLNGVTPTITTDATVAATLASVVTGSAGLTKAGGGTLTLSNTNTYSGETFLNDGRIVVVNNAALSNGGVTISGGTLTNSGNRTLTNAITASGGTITAAEGTDFTINSAVTGTGNVEVAGVLNRSGLLFGGDNSGFAGTITVTGANTRLNTATAASAAATWVVDGNLQLNRVGTTTYEFGELSSTASTGGISGHAINGATAISTLKIGALNTNSIFGGIIVNNATGTAATGNIDGASNNVLALEKVGTGTLTLSGANTYSGTTTITAGTLRVGDGGTTGTLGSGAVVNNATLRLDRSNALAVGNAISGTGAVIQAGSGTTTLSGNSSYGGGTAINAGTLIVSTSNNALGTGTITLDGGTLASSGTNSSDIRVLNNATSVVSGSIIANQANLTLNGNLTGSGAVTLAGVLNQSAVLFGGDNSDFTGTITVTGANTRLNTATAASAAATWVVDGNLQLNRVGTTTYEFGELSSTVSTGGISGHAANGSPTTSTLRVGALDTNSTFSGIIVDLPANNAATGNLDNAANNLLALEKVGTGTLTLSGANTYSGTTTITAGTLRVGDGGTTGTLGSGAVVNNTTLRLDRSNALTVGNAISGTGAVIQAGSGTTTLSGNSSYGGGTAINAGTLIVSTSNNALGTGTITLDGGTLASSGTNSSDIRTLSNAISVVSGSIIANQADFTINGAVSGNGNVEVAGVLNQSAVLFGGDNSGFAGTITVTGANTRLNTASAASAAATWVVDGNLQLNRVGTTTYEFGELSSTVSTGGISGHAANGSPTTSTLRVGALDTNSTFSGIIVDLPANNAATGNLDNAANNLLALEKVGTGTLTLSGANTYSGGTTILQGTLVGGVANIPGDISLDGIAPGAATLEFDQATDATYTGVISTNTAANTGSVVKSGIGNLILSGANTYTQPTSVAAGRLSVNAALASTAVTVSGGELGGTGVLAGTVAVQNGGRLAPGNSIGVLTQGDTSFASGGTFEYEVDSSDLNDLANAADLLVVNGNLHIAAGTLLEFSDLAGLAAQAFVEDSTVFAMINYTGAWNNGLFTYNGQSLADGSRFSVGSQLWEIDYDYVGTITEPLNFRNSYVPASGTQAFVTVTAVPEPAALVLLAAAAGLAALAARRPRA